VQPATAYDVLVVGAGPTGSNAARLLAGKGWKVLLVEEHPEVGHPVQCAGLVTPRTFEHTPFPIGDLHQNDLRGGIVVAPDGTQVEFASSQVQAQAMDRARFDQRMAEHAVKAGVELRVATKATGARRDPGGVTVTLSRMGLVSAVEHAIKKPVFGCRMCGQCVLHDTGMTCPMTCPKELRNGPCGGVRPDGRCEHGRCVQQHRHQRQHGSHRSQWCGVRQLGQRDHHG